jgi:hypothetical protein
MARSLSGEKLVKASQIWLSITELQAAGGFTTNLVEIRDLFATKAAISNTFDPVDQVNPSTQYAIAQYILGLLSFYVLQTDFVSFQRIGSPEMPLLTYLGNYRLLTNIQFPGGLVVQSGASTDTLQFNYDNTPVDLETKLKEIQNTVPSARNALTQIFQESQIHWTPKVTRNVAISRSYTQLFSESTYYYKKSCGETGSDTLSFSSPSLGVVELTRNGSLVG